MRSKIFYLLFISYFFIPVGIAFSQPVSNSVDVTASMPNWYQVPSKYTAIVQIEIYGKGGSGSSDGDGGGGGGGAAYARVNSVSLTPGFYDVVYSTTQGVSFRPAGGSASSSFARADNGKAGTTDGSGINSGPPGAGGSASSSLGDFTASGGNGGAVGGSPNFGGGGGGQSGSTSGDGSVGSSSTDANGASGGGSSGADGSGGRGGDNSPGTVAQYGSGPGGGGGGRSDGNATVGTGAPGRVIITVLSFLPIQISSFEITPSKTPSITWTTLAESDNSHFILERSREGEDFIKINTIQGKGTTDAKNEYAYTDVTPYKGTNYYRLKQVDYDGTMTSFGIKSAYVTVDQIEVYPTMMQDLIRIEMPKTDRPMQWSISNSLGQRSLKGILAPGEVKDAVSVQQLTPGTYFLSLKTQYGQEVFKLIKL